MSIRPALARALTIKFDSPLIRKASSQFEAIQKSNFGSHQNTASISQMYENPNQSLKEKQLIRQNTVTHEALLPSRLKQNVSKLVAAVEKKSLNQDSSQFYVKPSSSSLFNLNKEGEHSKNVFSSVASNQIRRPCNFKQYENIIKGAGNKTISTIKENHEHNTEESIFDEIAKNQSDFVNMIDNEKFTKRNKGGVKLLKDKNESPYIKKQDIVDKQQQKRASEKIEAIKIEVQKKLNDGKSNYQTKINF